MMIVMKLSAQGRLLHSGTLSRCQKHTKGFHQPLEEEKKLFREFIHGWSLPTFGSSGSFCHPGFWDIWPFWANLIFICASVFMHWIYRAAHMHFVTGVNIWWTGLALLERVLLKEKGDVGVAQSKTLNWCQRHVARRKFNVGALLRLPKLLS